MLEGALSRSDERVADVIESAWRGGARFDAWTDMFQEPAWERAFADAGTSIDAEAVLGHSAAEAIPGWADAVDTVPVSVSPDPGHDEVVIPIEDPVDLRAPGEDHLHLLPGQRQLAQQPVRRHQRLDPLDPAITDRVGGARGSQRHLHPPGRASAGMFPTSASVFPAIDAAARTRSR